MDDNDEHVYGNVRDFKAGTRRDRLQVQPQGGVRSPSKATAVCLGLLCVLLLAGIIGLWFYHTNHDHNTLTHEKDLVQTSSNNVIKESDQLRTKFRELERKLCDEATCHSRWRKFNCSCYYISTEKKTWNESRQDCLSRGADLVIINSRDEQVFLTGFHSRLWIGLSDPASDRHFKWVDGSDLTTGYWGTGEPNHYLGETEDCVET